MMWPLESGHDSAAPSTVRGKVMSSAMMTAGVRVVFAVEMAAKIFAFGLKQYLQDGWNTFDGIIVVGSIVTIMFNAGSLAQVITEPTFG